MSENTMIKKFISKLFIFCLPFFFVRISAEIMLRNIPNSFQVKKNNFNQSNYEVVFFGSSHIYRGVNPKFINLPSFNFANVSQSIDQDFKIYQKFIKNSNPKIIVIPHSYMSFYKQLKNSKENWRLKNYAIYYNIFEGINLKNYFEIFSMSIEKNYQRLLNYYFKNEYKICANNGYGYWNKNMNKVNIKESKKAVERHTKFLKSDSLELDSDLNNWLKLLNSKNTKIVFLTTPCHKIYFNQLNPERWRRDSIYIQNIKNKYKNIWELNFLKSPSFSNSEFKDSNHLNNVGAIKFSKILNGFFN